MNVNQLRPIPSDRVAEVVIGLLAPDCSTGESQLRKRADLIIVSRKSNDLMTSSFQQSRLIGDHQILTSSLLIEIMNLQNFHVVLFTVRPRLTRAGLAADNRRRLSVPARSPAA